MKRSRRAVALWGGVSAAVAIILVLVTVLTQTMFFDILCIVLGGKKAQYADGFDPIYTTQYTNKAEVTRAADELNQLVAEEGFVLLKNENGALPLKTPASDSGVTGAPRVSVFGKNNVNIAYGGSGSGGGSSADAVDLYQSLEEAGYEVNPVLKSFYEDDSRSGSKRAVDTSDLDSGKVIGIATFETPQEKYTAEVTQSYSQYNDMALVVFTRIGGEGFDLPLTMKGSAGARREDDHYLQLDQNETDLLKTVCTAGFQRVVVIINSAAAMELGFLEDPDHYAYSDKIDAAVWMGFPGNSGAMALGRILNGSVNPSGRTADTYVSNLKNDPTWQNFGSNRAEGGDQYINEATGQPELYYFVDYEESIYVGYRYYETRGATDGEGWYEDAVVYPFGYGLSYTTFDWAVDAGAVLNQGVTGNGKYEIRVSVTNTGSTAGKEVVQLYAHAPYTAGGIEKPEVVLVDFAKTGLLAPNETEELTLTFDPYYLASYDYKDKNGNGRCAFELDGGEGYCLYVAQNAHDRSRSIPFAVAGTIVYDTDPVTGYPVENRYTDQDDALFNSDLGLESVLSRGDWTGTMPQTDTERLASAELLSALKDTDSNNPNDYSGEPLPWFDSPVEITLRDMLYNEAGEFVGTAFYDDPRWEQLLDGCNLSELIGMYDYGAFKTGALQNIGKPQTNDTDGPAGFVNFMDKAGTYWGTCYYACETVMAATWNTDLITQVGEMVGAEGIVGADGRGNGLPYSGWYAPAANIHRSAFGGRNFEYYSEDPLLSGKMAAAEIAGCQSKGVYCYMKHFALNEQETHRSINGDCSWATEQSMREIYLRPFEIAVKEGGTRAIMSSFNRIGTRWTGGDYRLLTEILRNEWGFRGMVICDFNTIPQYMNSRQMAYAGGDINLVAYDPVSWCDASDVSDLVVIRRCAKNVLYTVANSNALNGEIVGYSMPVWCIALYAVDAVIAIGLAVWGIIVWRRYFRRRKDERV